MSATFTIARRELSSYFRLPVGWFTIALFLFLCGCVFGLVVLAPGRIASLRAFFGGAGWILLPVVPAISMRLFSEEMRSGTIEPLITSPVREFSIVLGKFLGAAAMLALMLLPTLLYAGVLAAVSPRPPEAGPLVAGYLSLLLPGIFYLSIGTLCSALTNNQTLAFLATLFILLALMLTSALGPAVAPISLQPVLAWLSFDSRIQDFAKGVIDLRHVVFFLAASVFPILLAGTALRARRLG
ncbi:MAG: ABC transporter permease subunit [Phycisphaeraceae bacterium]|nr:ABC transporter permease subunit [Phycisphaeraceae bacterium]